MYYYNLWHRLLTHKSVLQKVACNLKLLIWQWLKLEIMIVS